MVDEHSEIVVRCVLVNGIQIHGFDFVDALVFQRVVYQFLFFCELLQIGTVVERPQGFSRLIQKDADRRVKVENRQITGEAHIRLLAHLDP